jgi:hypothetical protein
MRTHDSTTTRQHQEGETTTTTEETVKLPVANLIHMMIPLHINPQQHRERNKRTS